MIAFSLFPLPSFRNGNIAAIIVSLGEFGIILSLPLWLQFVLGFDALQTGFVLLALAIGSFVASGAAGAFGGRFAPVWIVRVGIAGRDRRRRDRRLVIATDTSWWQIVLGLFVYGFGVGLATAQLTGVVLSDVRSQQSGQASGTQSTSRQVGSALGIAILGTVLFTSLGDASRREPASAVPEAQRDRSSISWSTAPDAAIPALEEKSPRPRADAREAFSDATRYAAFTAAGFLGSVFSPR